MDDLHWFQRFLHIFFFNLIVFGLFYLAFSPHRLSNISADNASQPLRAASK